MHNCIRFTVHFVRSLIFLRWKSHIFKVLWIYFSRSWYNEFQNLSLPTANLTLRSCQQCLLHSGQYFTPRGPAMPINLPCTDVDFALAGRAATYQPWATNEHPVLFAACTSKTLATFSKAKLQNNIWYINSPREIAWRNKLGWKDIDKAEFILERKHFFIALSHAHFTLSPMMRILVCEVENDNAHARKRWKNACIFSMNSA